MKGWFDAFRDDGAPTLYSFSNRTPVTGDVAIVAVSVLFATLYIAFLVIFPGVRKQVKCCNSLWVKYEIILKCSNNPNSSLYHHHHYYIITANFT